MLQKSVIMLDSMQAIDIILHSLTVPALAVIVRILLLNASGMVSLAEEMPKL